MPLFKENKILTVNDIHKVQVLKILHHVYHKIKPTQLYEYISNSLFHQGLLVSKDARHACPLVRGNHHMSNYN